MDVNVAAGRGTTVDRRQARRRQVIDATLRVIDRDGRDQATLRAIARELGSTVGVLTHQFISKDELMLAVYRSLVGELLQAALGAAAGRTGLRRLEAIMVCALPTTGRRASQWRVWVGMLGQITVQGALLDEERQGNLRFLEAIRAELGGLRELDQVDPELDLDLEARAITAMVDGVGIAAVLQPSAYPPRLQRGLVRRHLDRFTRA